MGFLKGAGEIMYLAEITFPSGFWFTVKICSLSTAVYWARVFSCNVLVMVDEVGSQVYRKEWEN